MSDAEGFAERAVIAALVAAGVGAFFASVWYTAEALAPMIIGVLFGIFVAELAGLLTRPVPALRGKWAVGATLLLLVAGTAVLAYALGTRIAEQFSRLLDIVPRGVQQVRSWAEHYPRLKSMLGAGGGGAQPGTLATALKGMSSVVAVTAAFGVGVFTAFFTGVFLAFSPEFYSSAVLTLVPPASRPRWRKLLASLWRQLWLWSLGRLLVMTAIGVAHILAYWLMGVPLPVALGVIAGVLSFIPYLGPILATVPAVLVAATVSPELALWVIVVHAVVETLESHLLTPVTQRYMVDVPALVTVASFLYFGAMMGITGVIVAAPLSAALIVIVRELYVEGILEAGPSAS